MVAKDENNQPTQVPGLTLESRDDARRFLEAIKRKELKNQYRQELDNAKTSLLLDEQLHLLEKERCRYEGTLK
jgi:hypothetical protein